MPAVRTAARTLQGLVEGLGAAFVSPPDVSAEASEAEFEMAVDVDQLQATVIGGLGSRSITTGSVLDGIEEAESLLSTYGTVMTPQQSAAVRELLDALRSA